MKDCELCARDGGELLWRDGDLRVVLVDDADYPGFVRVIWNAHVAEMSELSSAQRLRIMDVVNVVESAQRAALAPAKINLASFGNMVPHLHWHVIPRWRDDAHFPQPVWGARQREPEASVLAERRGQLATLKAEIEARLLSL